MVFQRCTGSRIGVAGTIIENTRLLRILRIACALR
jgi:hypothetical protein